MEDEGEGVCFCVYAYNVQPGVTIDYATGDSWLSEEGAPAEEPAEEEPQGTTYVLNTQQYEIPFSGLLQRSGYQPGEPAGVHRYPGGPGGAGL